MDYFVTLKELANKYTDSQIIDEIGNTYGMNIEDLEAFLNLLEKIRNSPFDERSEYTINYLVIMRRGKEGVTVIPVAGLSRNGKVYKLTAKNTQNIEVFAGYKMKIPEDDNALEVIAHTELQWFILVMLSLNAFSPEIVRLRFNGDPKLAKAGEYLVTLIKIKEEEDAEFD